MVSDLILIVLFVGIVIGAGAILLPPGSLSATERFTAGIAACLVGLYVYGFGAYALALPKWSYIALPLTAAALIWRQRLRLADLLRDPDVPTTLAAWAAVTFWTLAWQFSVVSYSGDGWSGDWVEHYERARYFSEHWPVATKLLQTYSISARPPLSNVLTSVFFNLTHPSFTGYQIMQVLTSTLVVWPLRLLQLRFADPKHPPSVIWIAIMLMALPTFIENATFPWTKLLTTFFVLVGVYFIETPKGTWTKRAIACVALTAGMLTHYSTGPWLVGLGAALIVQQLTGWKPIQWRKLGAIVGVCIALFGTWLLWAVLNLGLVETFTSNTTVSGVPDLTWTKRAATVAQNIYTTVVPHTMRFIPESVLTAREPVSDFRDTFFNVYQTNLFGLLGSVGGIVAGWLWFTKTTPIPRARRQFWSILFVVSIFTGIAVNAEPSGWGVAHICLQPWGLLVLAWIASRIEWTILPRRVLTAGLALDFTLGIVLQFALQSMRLLRWMYPNFAEIPLLKTAGIAAYSNYLDKLALHEPFLADRPGNGIAFIGLMAVALIALVLSALKLGPSRPSLTTS